MENRASGFVALLVVIGVSIVFGMVVGGRLNAPQVVHAAPNNGPVRLAPASTIGAGVHSFADIVEQALPAVVGVTSTKLRDDGEGGGFMGDDFFERFFGAPEDPEENGPSEDRPRIGEGSGFIISPDGYILTNNHVVERADTVSVALQGNRIFEAAVVGTDPSIDLALLKVDPGDETLPVLSLGDSEALRVGEWVIAIGNPLEFEQTVTVGVISGKGRRVNIGQTDAAVVSFIQTDAAINFGNSGGPLLDSRGNVIGINTAIARVHMSEGIGFALPINHARSVMEQLRQTGEVRRGFIGITMNDNGVDDEARAYHGLSDLGGVIVSAVQKDGPAEKAGVRAGDIIRRVDGTDISDNLDLVSKIASRMPGERVKLEIFRSGKTLRLNAVLEDRQAGLDARFGRGGESEPAPEEHPEEPEPKTSSGLGLTFENISSRMRREMRLDDDVRGVLVTDAEFNSEAFRKGIQPGMIVAAINDEPIENVSDWTSAMDGMRLVPGRPVKLDVLIVQAGRESIRRFVYLKLPATD